MFDLSIQYYDEIYSFKDYPAEARRIQEIVHEQTSGDNIQLLDVACGTGKHLDYLKQYFTCQGLDISPDLVEIAQNRNPDLKIRTGDMREFTYRASWNVITCLFSSIGYITSDADLSATFRNFHRHLERGGVLIIEPWLTPEAFVPETTHAVFIDKPQLKIARINTSSRNGNCSVMDLHYLVGTPEKTEYFMETHELRLLTVSEMLHAMVDAGFDSEFDPKGLTGRGLFIGVKK